MKITSKAGSLNESERLEIARLLVKAGYAVRLGKDKVVGKKSTYIYFVEYWEEKKGES